MQAAEAGSTNIQILENFLPLIDTPHTIADIHGGRYGAKTEQVHKIAVKLALEQPLRIVGARETLQSTQDSSHKTISDIIYSYDLATSQNGPFDIQKDRIIRRDGDRIVSEFFYIGVRENIRDKKSLAGIDLMIFDEAGKCSKDTLNVFLPTVIGRKHNSRAWFIWNPESVVDPIYVWLMGVPGPSDCIHIVTDYRDNPWLSLKSRRLVEDCARDDYELYEHLYLGKPISSIKGAIFGEEMKKALEEKRIGSVPYNRLKPVYTAWDIGLDRTVCWFVQCYENALWFIDCLSGENLPMSDYLVELQSRRYVYGRHHLPHDGVDSMLHRKGMMGGNQDKSATVQSIMTDAGYPAFVGPKLGKTDRINFTRTRFPICHFDAVKCAEGIESLRQYQWDREPDDKGQRKPLHNWHSHPVDAFMEACVSVKELAKRPIPVAHSGMVEADI